MSEQNKMRMWELFVRVIAVSIAFAGPVIGYQFKTLADADKESMRDRNAIRERVAVNAAMSVEASAQRVEMRQLLLRIEDKLDSYIQQQKQQPH